jgi:hypothetical protein
MTGQFGQISTFGSDGLEQTRLWNGAWGVLLLWDGSVTNDQTVVLSATSDSGGQLRLQDATGGSSVFLEGGTGTVNAEGSLNVVDSIGGTTLGRIYDFGSGSWVESFDPAGDRTGIMGTGSGGDGGFMHLYNSSDVITVRIDGDDGDAGLIEVSDVAGADRVRIDGQSTGTGGEISVFDDDGTETVEILGAETATQGGQILLRKADGTTTIEIDGDFNGDGRIITQELQITGGSDLSEQFDVGEALGTGPAPGMVVSIDPNRPGKLIVSAKAYDRTVAGIISGAGGVDTGLYMGQKGTPADGSHPVALTGRVYCWCDATRGAIQPGDLLTTSATPGYAMKVRDHARAQGAILGKAMTSLDEGRGLVLVLVTLQ